MYDTQQDILDAFGAAPEILAVLLAGYHPAPGLAVSGGEVQWSVVEVVCHLRDAEERALERMRLMRDTDDPWLAGYDQDAWARERGYAAADLPATLAAFVQMRAQYLTELAALPADAWQRRGRHAEEGPITIHAHTLHQVAHTAQHTAQIARLLRGGAGPRDP